MPRTGRGKPKKERAKEDISKQVGRHDRVEYWDRKGANANINAIFKQGDKELAKESNKKHINKGSAGVRKGYNSNTNAFRQLKDKETGELSKKQEIYHYKSFFDEKN
jgi:hypothetical protein